MQQVPDGRSGVFEAPPAGWWLVLETVGPLVLLALVAVLVLRALLRRGRYRAIGVLDEAGQTAVRDALRSAERRTSGEIVAVVVERSDRHADAHWLAAIAAVLIGTTLLGPWLPWSHPVWLVGCQAVFGLAGYALARALPDIRRWFLSEARASEVAEEQAEQEFLRQGLSRTQNATGVLIFTTLLEHRVVVLGDEGIAADLDPEFWASVRDAILSGIRAGSLRDGLIAGIAAAGDALATHAPRGDDDRNELPDHLVLRRE